MRSVPSQASGQTVQSHLLFEIYLTGGTQYFTTADRPLVYSGITYNPFPLRIGEVKRSAQGLSDQVTLVLSNVSREIAGLLLSESFRGKRIVIYRALLSDDYTVAAPLIIFDGVMDEVTGKEEKDDAIITATCTTELAYWQKSIPGRQYQATCPWEFKSAVTSEGGCGYAGAETWCNKTWERCKVLGNTARFAGFRHLPKLEGTQIWWGKADPTPGVGGHVGIRVWR